MSWEALVIITFALLSAGARIAEFNEVTKRPLPARDLNTIRRVLFSSMLVSAVLIGCALRLDR